jgi:hypothetical protein
LTRALEQKPEDHSMRTCKWSQLGLRVIAYYFKNKEFGELVPETFYVEDLIVSVPSEETVCKIKKGL